MTSPAVPRMIADCAFVTLFVVTVNVVLVDPAGTVTLGGTVAAVVLSLESDTRKPPDGAAAVSVTVPVAPPAPRMSVGLEAVREIERLVETAPLRATVDLAEGLLEAAGGNHERARTLLEDAVDRFERGGAPFEASQARIELATSLAALGQADVAEREASAALNACAT